MLINLLPLDPISIQAEVDFSFCNNGLEQLTKNRLDLFQLGVEIDEEKAVQ